MVPSIPGVQPLPPLFSRKEPDLGMRPPALVTQWFWAAVWSSEGHSNPLDRCSGLIRAQQNEWT